MAKRRKKRFESRSKPRAKPQAESRAKSRSGKLSLAFPVPKGYQQIDYRYGKFSWHDIDNDRGAAITIEPEWAKLNLVTVNLPSLLPHPVYIHRLVAEPFARAVRAACSSRSDYKINSCVSFVPRHKNHDQKKPLSLHTWGIAIDINPATNRLGAKRSSPPSSSKTVDRSVCYDMPAEFIAAFKAEGFFWGGDFKSPKDPMHFQLATGA